MTGVEPAFGLLLLFPPPAPGAFGLIGFYGTGAGRTADRKKAAVVQPVVRDSAFADEGDNAVARPVEKRVDFDYPMLWIDAGAARHCALGRLGGAQSGDPRRSVGKSATQGRNFAH